MNFELKLIQPTDSIGDTLSSINENYKKLEEWFNSISLSATNYWKPVADFYKDFSPTLKTNIDNGLQKLPNWINVSTLIEENSAKWVEPLIIHYPEVVKLSEQVNNSFVDTVTNWLNLKFPVLNNGCPNGVCYIENSQCIVHVMRQDTSDSELVSGTKTRRQQECEPASVTDFTLCQTSDTLATANCNVSYSGSVNCGKRTPFRCGGSRSCTVTQKVGCTFSQNGSKQYIPSIKANIFYNFVDDYLKTDLFRLNYKVANCKWILIGEV